MRHPTAFLAPMEPLSTDAGNRNDYLRCRLAVWSKEEARSLKLGGKLMSNSLFLSVVLVLSHRPKKVLSPFLFSAKTLLTHKFCQKTVFWVEMC